MFSQDYILREIEGLTRFLAKTVLHKDLENEHLVISEDGQVSGDGFFLHTLLNILSEGRVNEAENLLHEQIEADPRPEYMTIALEFYRHLAAMSREELEACNFSHEEVAEGLEAVGALYGVPKLGRTE